MVPAKTDASTYAWESLIAWPRNRKLLESGVLAVPQSRSVEAPLKRDHRATTTIVIGPPKTTLLRWSVTYDPAPLRTTPSIVAYDAETWATAPATESTNDWPVHGVSPDKRKSQSISRNGNALRYAVSAAAPLRLPE